MNISVFITSYNQKAYLQEAVESVLAQTLPPGQIIIVDDCSGDGSQALIEGFQARYPDLITSVFHAQNLGVAQVRKSALQAVTGDYVTYVDGDDRFLPAKLEKESALLTGHPQAQIAFSNSYYMTVDGRQTTTWITAKNPPEGDVFVETLTRRYPRGNLFRMELLPYALWEAVGFHDVALNVLEDWDMRIRLTRQYSVVYLDEPLSEIRVHPHGLSNVDASTKLRAFEYVWQKNEALLDDLSPAERNAVISAMDRLHAAFVRQQAKEALGAYGQVRQGNKSQAWSFYRESWNYHHCLDFDLLSGLILPARLYLPFRNSMRKLAGKRDGR